MGTVVGINGSPVPDRCGEPSKDVISRLEDLLERARSGEINGIAIVAHYRDETTYRAWAGHVSYSVVGQLAQVQRHLLVDLEK